MSKKYYRKNKFPFFQKINFFKTLSVGIILIGIVIIAYVFFPLVSWQFYFAPVFADQNIASPIPKINIVGSNTIESLLSQASSNLIGVNYENAQNWFPTFNPNLKNGKTKIETYSISIPSLGITDALVSTMDNNLGVHLVNYQGTSIPPSRGNAVVFGHSTLPQLYNPKDYKTIFANAYKLTVGEEINVKVENLIYNYKITSIIVVDPKDTSVFEQDYNDSFLTLVTCTPPGTIWKRLIIKSVLQKVKA
jgi:sortase A